MLIALNTGARQFSIRPSETTSIPSSKLGNQPTPQRDFSAGLSKISYSQT
jgi:hypothetical protein